MRQESVVDILVVAVEKALEEFWWLMNSCSPPAIGANTSYSSRTCNSRYSNSGTVSVAATFKKSSTEVTFCRVWALLGTIPTPRNLIRDTFYDTLDRVQSIGWTTGLTHVPVIRNRPIQTVVHT